MNKRDFYKELMSEYMFDKDKICANAKKGKFAGRKSLPIYIGMTAAVAAVVVVAGTAAFTLLGRNNDAILSSVPLAQLTEQQRVESAIDEILKKSESKEEVCFIVYFKEPVSPSMAKGILTGYSGGSIPIKMLYMTDGTKVFGTNEIGAVLKNNTGEITAAGIQCAEYLGTKIYNNDLVALVEKCELSDMAELTLLDTQSLPELPATSDNVSDSTTSSDNTGGNSSSGIGTSTHEPVDVDDPIFNNNGTSDSDTSSDTVSSGNSSDNTSSGSGTSSDNTSSDTSGDNNSSDTSNTSSSNTSDTSSSGTSEPNTSNSDVSDPNNSGSGDGPKVSVNKLPEGVELPTTAERPAYITDDIGAQRAYFLSEDVFYVKTENAVKLYKYNGERETLTAEQNINDAKVAWVSENGLRLMVSGVENGARRKLYIIDAKNCTINDMQVDEMVGEGSITEAAYNESSDLFAMDVLDGGSKYIFTANLSGYHVMNSQIAAYGSEYMMILASHGSTVYYSEIKGGLTVICKTGELENTEVLPLGGLYVSNTNSAFTHALMLSDKGIGIFDPATESIIAINSAKAVSFGASAHSFSDGSSYFTVSGGAIVPEGRVSEIAKIDFTRSFSSKYAAAVSNGSVRIIPSVYTSRVREAGITFEQPVEKASAEQRNAVDRGIGIINALASGTCKECGITSSDKLIETIDACFCESAANALVEKCDIPSGEDLVYSNGALPQTNVADTVLVMENDNTGKLYIKVGTFEGRTAYTVRNVVLVNENGLKLGALI